MKPFHRHSKIKHFRHWRIVIAIIFFLIVIFGILFFINRSTHFFRIQKIAPLPTGLDPHFMTSVNDCFIPTAAAYGYTLRITAGFRSLAQQDQMYQQGRTTTGHIVTEADSYRSIHNYGFAVDVVDRWRGYKINWSRLVKIGAYCGLESGGSGDLPHFEHRGGLSTADFEAGKRPTPLTLPCPIMATRANANQPLTRKDLKSCGSPTF